MSELLALIGGQEMIALLSFKTVTSFQTDRQRQEAHGWVIKLVKASTKKNS